MIKSSIDCEQPSLRQHLTDTIKIQSLAEFLYSQLTPDTKMTEGENIPPFKPSPMARKFMLAAEKGRHPSYYGNRPERPFEEVYYFFYGTLMDPITLGHVLKRPDTPEPEVHKATIEAYRMKLWGEYPALIMGFPERTIHGVACKIKSREEVDRLAAYECGMYGADYCAIRFEDGSTVSGWTFVWNADESLLREGTFDFEDWLSKKKQHSADDQ